MGMNGKLEPTYISILENKKNIKMKNRQFIYLKMTLLSSLIFMSTVSCERELSDEVEFATFPNNPEVFIDGFSAGLEYLPFAGSKFDAFTVDAETKFAGSASMRFDVPNVGDPTGAFSGAIFPDNGGRDLSGYDALTFWAKATQAGTINEIGFGQDFGENKFLVTKANLRISTNWVKYIIPIPEPSKLTLEKGMFWYAEGPENNDGYTFWIDELKYEKLGTIAQPQPAIFSGVDDSVVAFLDTEFPVTGITQTFNLPSGINETVVPAPSYFTFNSSDVDVARISELGVISPVGLGSAKITATLGGVKAKGSLTLEVTGSFDFAPIPPTRDPSDVISIFSDAYTNVAVDYYNGFFNSDGQTTQGGSPPMNINGDQIINYTDLNFVGIGTFLNVPTINATEMVNLHVDIKVNEAIDAGDSIILQLINSVGNNETSGSITLNADTFTTNEWVSLDIPLANFTGLSSRSELGLLFFISNATISNILVDNIYFYK